MMEFWIDVDCTVRSISEIGVGVSWPLKCLDNNV